MALRILVADDSETNRMLLSMTLKRHGVEADVVANGRDAADFFARYRYDLVFLDLNMPVMDGITTARRILQHQEKHPAKSAPVYAISGFPSPEAEAHFTEAGIRRCLIKPLDREKLTEVMAECGLAPGAPPPPDPYAAPLPADGEVPPRLLKAYARELRLRAKACAVYRDEGNRRGLLRESHTIRALGQMLGRLEVETEAEKVETAAAHGTLSEVPLDRMTEACLRAAEEIEAGLQAGGH